MLFGGLPTTGHWRLTTGYWLLATGYWLLATGYWLLATGYWRLTPRRQPAQQHCQDTERQDHQQYRRQQSLSRRESHLVGGVAEEALREQLPADDHVPAH